MSSPPDGDWVEHPDLVEFFSSHRGQPEDLYPSERRFVPWLARESDSVLDVACGAGGFASIWSHFNPGIRYVGVDASEALVAAARRLHPERQFVRADGATRMPFPDATADVVATLGWLHWEPRYRDALAELWRLAGRRLFFDVRLQNMIDGDVMARQRLAYDQAWDGQTTTPYIAASWEQFARVLLALEPARILGLGYAGDPADTVVGLEVPLCFATFVLERGPVPPRGPEVLLDFPWVWPEGLPGTAARLDESVAAVEPPRR